MEEAIFTPEDLEELRQRGVSTGEALRQIRLLRRHPGFVRLERPCALGDGIESIPDEELESLIHLHDRAAEEGRCLKFVPASGVATRMFRDLLAPDAARSGALRRFMEGLGQLPFAGDLEAHLARSGSDLRTLIRNGQHSKILDALLSERGMGYEKLAKGLLKFHSYVDGARTPLEEHAVEAAGLVRDRHSVCRMHFTVSTSQVDAFRSHIEEVKARFEQRFGVRYQAELSVQKPSSDTLAVDPAGNPFRGEDGALLFRPAGHGALLENLEELRGDIIIVRNIDNVAPDRFKPAIYRWTKALTGRLLLMQGRISELLRRLEDEGDARAAREAAKLAREELHRECPEDSRSLAGLLDRPLRVCGVVPNAGDPGGGPFWVRGKDRSLGLQIVESSQVDPASERQRELFTGGTHVNPVFMVLGVRNRHGVPYELGPYVDPEAVIVTRKTAGDRDLIGLERPGLWNGSMALWNTVFVAMPREVFNPVKTVFDLLRPEHQA